MGKNAKSLLNPDISEVGNISVSQDAEPMPQMICHETRDSLLIVTLKIQPLLYQPKLYTDHAAQVRAELTALIETQSEHCNAILIYSENYQEVCGTAIDAASEKRSDDPRQKNAPSLAQLCHTLEAGPKPVVILLDGMVMGPAAELALAAHYRLATTQMRMVFPNIGLGLPCETGASQRLARLLCAKECCQILLHAQMIGAQRGLKIGLIDQLYDRYPFDNAIEFVNNLIISGGLSRTEPLRDIGEFSQTLAAYKASLTNMFLPAPLRILDCIEASLYLPFENGLQFEQACYEDLMATPEADALLALAKAEQRAAYFPKELSGEARVKLRYLGVLGADAPQIGFVLLALAQGIELFWYDKDPHTLQQGFDLVAKRLHREEETGHIATGLANFALKRLHLCGSLDQLNLAHSVIRGGPPERYDLRFDPKTAAFSPQILGLNDVVRYDENGVSLSFSVAPSLRLAELAVPKAGLPQHDSSAVKSQRPIGRALQMLRALGVNTVMVGDRPSVGREVFLAGRQALVQLYLSGVGASQIEQALAQFGQIIPVMPSQLPDRECEPRVMPAAEIINRWLYAMGNKGLSLIDAGDLCHATDIDVIMVQGYGFPRWHGGPMYKIKRHGLQALRADLLDWQNEAKVWAPAPILDKIQSKGSSLATFLDR